MLGYIQIARVDHWIKNVFVLPGILVALSIDRGLTFDSLRYIVAMLAVCLITSSNYVLNEILDARHDRAHPYKKNRPLAKGSVRPSIAYVEWLALAAIAGALALRISLSFTWTIAALWIAGCLYNIPPVRAKDVPYFDVLWEAINNPLRLLAGWYMTGTAAIPITSLLISYWMTGCYFMAIKRYAEFRELGSDERLAYRKSLAAYSEQTLLVVILFYATCAMLFFGAFIARYRLELVLSFPLIAAVMAVYLWLAFKPNSPVQHPEGLFREPLVVIPVSVCAAAMGMLLFIDVPLLHNLFPPTRLP